MFYTHEQLITVKMHYYNKLIMSYKGMSDKYWSSKWIYAMVRDENANRPLINPLILLVVHQVYIEIQCKKCLDILVQI